MSNILKTAADMRARLDRTRLSTDLVSAAKRVDETSKAYFDADPDTRSVDVIVEFGEALDALRHAASYPAPATHVVGWIYEDELPKNYPYDAMFPHSKVDGVRMFPVFAPPSPQMEGAAADAYVAEQGIEHSGGFIERAFEAGARWSARRSLPEGFTRREIEDMLSIVQDEPQTVDGGGEFGPQESTDGWYTRLLRTIIKNADGSR